MEHKAIKPYQARIISEALFPGANYLARLKKRMELRRFPPNDPLYVLTVEAYEAVLRLAHKVHYLSCEGGAG